MTYFSDYFISLCAGVAAAGATLFCFGYRALGLTLFMAGLVTLLSLWSLTVDHLRQLSSEDDEESN